MCAICVDAVKGTFPEYADDDHFIGFILWEQTAFPFVSAKYIVHQVLMCRGTIFIDGEGI